MEETMRLIGYALETVDGSFLVWKDVKGNGSGWHKADGRDLPFIFSPKQGSFAKHLANNGSLIYRYGKLKTVELFARNTSIT